MTTICYHYTLLFSLIACDYSDYFNSIGRGGRQLQVPPGLAPWFLPSFLPSKETLKGSFLVWWHQREVGDGAWVPGPNTWDPGPPSSEVPMTHLLCVLCFPAPSRWCPYPLAHSCTGLRLESCVGMLYVHTCVPVWHTCACICLEIHPFPEQFEQALVLLIRPSASRSLIEFNNCSVD